MSTPNPKPVARAPTTPAAEPSEPVTTESLGWQLRSALPPMRLHSISIYNNEADVLWLSEGALGPDEHGAVIEAIETLKGERGQLYHEIGMGDGRIAIFLGIRGARGELYGTVMILADMKSVGDSAMDRILTVPVKTLMQKIALLLRKMYPQLSETREVPSLTLPVVGLGEGKPGAPAAVGAASGTVLAPQQVEAILTLEVENATPVSRLGSAAKTAKAGANAGAPSTAATPAGARPAAAAKAAEASAPGSAPAPKAQDDIELLEFDANVSVVPARKSSQAAPSPEIEVLAFDPNVQVPPPRTTPGPPTAEIEVLDFDAELTIAPGSAAARTASAAAAASQAHSPATKAANERKPAATPEQSASSASAAVARKGHTSAAEPSSQKPVSQRKVSSVATVAVPVLNADTSGTASAARPDDVMLINDTGPVPTLEISDETTSVEPALPATPPPPPLSAAETATDLALYVQELIKLRSSGRTRRYEVLARSRRDAERNEVPTAFVADTARGREGAALDALVVERLLQWLGKHGETIWDSEPASFSVNLSVGALEDERFPKQIEKWLNEHAVPAEYVGFEVSEFACIQCRPAVRRFVDACEALGCFLVIDNFSFDSNVLEFLGSKALRHVKIDPKLTGAAMKEKLPQALVVAILQACKVLGVHCVAKRIDSQSALQWLRAVGCDFAQSFRLEKPAPIDSLVAGKSIQALRD